MNLMEAREKLKGWEEQQKTYGYAVSLINWDMATASPKKGKPHAARAMGVLSGKLYELQTGEEIRGILAEFAANEPELTPVEKRFTEIMTKQLTRMERIPQKDYQDYTELTSTAQFAWEEYKEKDDFEGFAPYLEKIVVYTRSFANLKNPEQKPYDVCLDDYEEGLTMDTLDVFFKAVKERTVPLVARITEAEKNIPNPLAGKLFSAQKQEAFSQWLLKHIGFDMEAGLLAESVHPFTTGINEGDTRLTTAFHEAHPTSSIFSTIHEGGHGLYDQHANISPIVGGTLLASGVSMGIHESQSRFYENILGRSYAFWEYAYPVLQSYFPEELKDVSVEAFYRYINHAQPGLIRIEADELTYNLHILIRYELEKGLIDGSIQVKDLPGLWNDKYQAYLGIKPPRHGLGVLQDVHWSGGSIGYFPSYALGNAYAAQITYKMKESLNLDELCRTGNLQPVGDWLNTHIHQYGELKKPGQLIQDITGKPLDPSYLMTYLEEKYQEIYFS